MNAIKALDRYLRARAHHRHADLTNLWLGRSGALTTRGIQTLIRRRCAQAGLPLSILINSATRSPTSS
jgi:site-specific recombinase XerC